MTIEPCQVTDLQLSTTPNIYELADTTTITPTVTQIPDCGLDIVYESPVTTIVSVTPTQEIEAYTIARGLLGSQTYTLNLDAKFAGTLYFEKSFTIDLLVVDPCSSTNLIYSQVEETLETVMDYTV